MQMIMYGVCGFDEMAWNADYVDLSAYYSSDADGTTLTGDVMTSAVAEDYTMTWAELTAEIDAIQICYYGYASYEVVCAYDDTTESTYCSVYEITHDEYWNPTVAEDAMVTDYGYYLADFLWMFAERDYAYYIYGDNCDYCIDYASGVFESECEITDYFDNIQFYDYCDATNGDDCSSYYSCDDAGCTFYVSEWGEGSYYTLEDLGTQLNDMMKCAMGYNAMLFVCEYDTDAVVCNATPQSYAEDADGNVDWTAAPTVSTDPSAIIPMTPDYFVGMFQMLEYNYEYYYEAYYDACYCKDYTTGKMVPNCDYEYTFQFDCDPEFSDCSSYLTVSSTGATFTFLSDTEYTFE